MLLIIISIVWVAGVFLGSIYTLHPLFILCSLIPLSFLIFDRRHKRVLITMSLCLLVFVMGTVRFAASSSGEDQIQSFNGSTITVTGMVNNDPELGDKTIQVELSVSQIEKDGAWKDISGKLLLFLPTSLDYHYGDILTVSGEMETPPSLSDFDYKGYLASQGVYSIMSYPRTEIVESNKGNNIIGWIYEARRNLAQSLGRLLPEPQASLAQGIIVGMRGNIPQDLKESFSQSGTSHILAVSGQNLSIIVGILLSLGIWLLGRRRHLYIWLALIIIWIYTIMTGINPPVVRAAIMASLFLFADLLGRQRSAGTALAFAGAIMIGVSPLVLWDVSFQLSFLSMLGLVIIAPHFQDFTHKVIERTLGDRGIFVDVTNIVLDSFGITLAAIILIWPLISYYFGIVSLVAPFSSLLAVPAMTGIIVIGAAAGGVGMFFWPFGQVLGWIAWLFLSYMIVVVKGFAAIPHSFINTGPISAVFIWSYYTAMAIFVWSAVNRQYSRRLLNVMKSIIYYMKSIMSHFKIKWLAGPLCIIAILVALAAWNIPDARLHVDFLDVGQGDAILVWQGDQQILIDGGPSAQAIELQLGKHLPFWDRTLELVVLTHPDADHLTGLVDVLSKYQVEKVLCAEFDSVSQIFESWNRTLEEKQIETIMAEMGQEFDLGNGILLEVLNPSNPDLFEDGSDDNGVVLRLNDGEVSFLFTGDISASGEFALISEQADLRSTVLKVAHHGSSGSTTNDFLDAVNPRIAVISVGRDNRYNHPDGDTLDRLRNHLGEAGIYRTDESGTIGFITDGNGLWMMK